MEFEVIFFNNLSKAIFGKNKKEFLLVNQFNMHWEYIQMIFFTSSMPNSFEKNLRLRTPISKALSSSLEMYSVFLGEILDFAKTRLICAFPSTIIFR